MMVPVTSRYGSDNTTANHMCEVRQAEFDAQGYASGIACFFSALPHSASSRRFRLVRDSCQTTRVSDCFTQVAAQPISRDRTMVPAQS